MAKVRHRHVMTLHKHCSAGIDRYLDRIGVSRETFHSEGVDSEKLRAFGGYIANTLADLAEAEEHAQKE
jgi:hypothetical protein